MEKKPKLLKDDGDRFRLYGMLDEEDIEKIQTDDELYRFMTGLSITPVKDAFKSSKGNYWLVKTGYYENKLWAANVLCNPITTSPEPADVGAMANVVVAVYPCDEKGDIIGDITDSVVVDRTPLGTKTEEIMFEHYRMLKLYLNK